MKNQESDFRAKGNTQTTVVNLIELNKNILEDSKVLFDKSQYMLNMLLKIDVCEKLNTETENLLYSYNKEKNEENNISAYLNNIYHLNSDARCNLRFFYLTAIELFKTDTLCADITNLKEMEISEKEKSKDSDLDISILNTKIFNISNELSFSKKYLGFIKNWFIDFGGDLPENVYNTICNCEENFNLEKNEHNSFIGKLKYIQTEIRISNVYVDTFLQYFEELLKNSNN